MPDENKISAKPAQPVRPGLSGFTRRVRAGRRRRNHRVDPRFDRSSGIGDRIFRRGSLDASSGLVTAASGQLVTILTEAIDAKTTTEKTHRTASMKAGN